MAFKTLISAKRLKTFGGPRFRKSGNCAPSPRVFNFRAPVFYLFTKTQPIGLFSPPTPDFASGILHRIGDFGGGKTGPRSPFLNIPPRMATPHHDGSFHGGGVPCIHCFLGRNGHPRSQPGAPKGRPHREGPCGYWFSRNISPRESIFYVCIAHNGFPPCLHIQVGTPKPN